MNQTIILLHCSSTQTSPSGINLTPPPALYGNGCCISSSQMSGARPSLWQHLHLPRHSGGTAEDVSGAQTRRPLQKTGSWAQQFSAFLLKFWGNCETWSSGALRRRSVQVFTYFCGSSFLLLPNSHPHGWCEVGRHLQDKKEKHVCCDAAAELKEPLEQ